MFFQIKMSYPFLPALVDISDVDEENEPYRPLWQHRRKLNKLFQENPELVVAFNEVEDLLIKRENHRPCIECYANLDSLCMGKVKKNKSINASGAIYGKIYSDACTDADDLDNLQDSEFHDLCRGNHYF